MRITDLLISLGRKTCTAKKPKCELCTLNKICPSAFTFKKNSQKKPQNTCPEKHNFS
jgi:adenine-specific DNA glycosylase